MKAETLKKSILQYAMQGKLVAQDPNDEPASELLKRIKAEKEQLIKDGKILKKKPLEPFTKSDEPFDIPESWIWVYLSDVSIIQEGAGIRSYQYRDSGTQLLTVTNILEDGIDLNKSTKFVDTEEYLNKYKHLTPIKGDIVTACSGGSWGKSAIFDKDNVTMLNTSTLRLRFFSDLANNKYLYYITKSKLFKNQLESQLSGMQPNFGYQHYSKILIPLPPLAEQQRIVEKLEEILPLVEEYGKNEEILSEMNKKLPKQIRQSILQYAIQGKLVPQDPNDEPASELLKRIKAEKEQLIKDGKILKKKPLEPFTKSDEPFDIPESWIWVYLSDVSIIQEGAGIRSYQYRDSGTQLLTVTNILEDGIDLNKSTKFVDTEEYLNKYKHLTPIKGDIVTACSGGSWGKSAIFDKDNVTMLNTSTLRLRFFSDLANNKYLYYITKSKLFKNQLESQLSGMQPNFGYQHYSKILIPLPPLAEQQRIVTKVEELMQIVDKLEINAR